MEQLLKGIKVVELGTHVAVPKAARMMAQWGAEVIKIEPPKGEAWRTIGRTWKLPYAPLDNPIFQNENSNKKSLVLNLKDREGIEVLFKLLETVDVFITNTRPRSLKKLGLDYESLKKLYPKLIYASLTGYGEVGPSRDDPGFDTAAFWARSGVLIEWSQKGAAPFKPHAGFGDSATGSMILNGVLAALYNRSKTGTGDYVGNSLYGTALWYNSSGLIMSQEGFGHHYPKASEDGTSPFSPLYQSKDGDWILVASTAWDKAAPDIFRLLGLDEYVGDPSYMVLEETRRHLGEVIEVLSKAFGRMKTEDIVAGLKRLDIVHMRLRNPAEVSVDPQAWENGYLTRVSLESGREVALPVCPLKFANIEQENFRLAPQLGENTRELLLDLGYDEDQIKTMETQGVTLVYEPEQ